MEVFTVVEHRLDAAFEQRSKRCDFHVPFSIAVTIQTILGLIVCGLLVWNLVDLDAARNGLPVFGRLGVILCLLFSFYFQKTIFSSHTEIEETHLLINLIIYTTTLLAGVSFWMVQMQYSSHLSPGVANYSSVEPVLVTTAVILGIYCLRRIMTHYDNSQSIQLDIYTSPLFPQILGILSSLEIVFGLGFFISMNFLVSDEYEYTKRSGCLVAIFISAVFNELAVMFSKESRSALLLKTAGFFVNLIGTQLTWWLSYYKERQLTIYGLGVGFLVLLFGVLYTVEMSLQTAQLNAHNPDNRRASFLHPAKSGDSKKDNNEEVDSATETISSQDEFGIKLLNRTCVIGFAVTLQIGLGLLLVVVLIQDIFYPATDPQKLSQDRIGNWCMWALGFLASLILNEVILFQDKMNFWFVSLANLAFCVNFLVGSVLSYRGIRMSMEEHGLPRNFMVVAAMWIPYFILSHIDFVRLTKFSLRLEERRFKKRRVSHSQVSMFVASGIQSMVAVAAFIPATDFGYFPGKIFSILTFPSLAFIAEVFFRFGKRYRGPFLVTFAAFFLGTAYSQLVWYISVVLDKEEEFLGMKKPWLVGLGVVMGLLAFLYVIRFLFIILTKWEKKE